MVIKTGANKTVRRAADSDQLTTKVVTAVAEINGVPPMDLDEKLYDVIAPDGLEMIFSVESGTPDEDPSENRSVAHLMFTMAGCEVVVYGDGRIIVTSEV